MQFLAEITSASKEMNAAEKTPSNLFARLNDPGVSFLLTKLSNLLTEQNVKAYVVGGFIRDALLKRDTADIDLAVAGNALEIATKVAAAFGGKYVLLDKASGVGRVVLANKEATLERGRWVLDFSTLKGSIREDLERRDFTIDAMAIELSSLEGDILIRGLSSELNNILIDPFNGYGDLYQGVIRAVTKTAFEVDGVRLLRAVRLAAELGFSVHNDTEALIRRHSHLITGIAGERVREELLRLLAIPGAEFLPYLDELGLLTGIILELAQAKGVEQPKEHFWNVFDHSLKTVVAVDFLLRRGDWEYATAQVSAVVPRSAELKRHFNLEVSSGSTRRLLLKLAALLHDIAKPQTKAIDSSGRMRFLGHGREGAAISTGILERLRFSTKEIKLVETTIKHHLRPVQMSQDRLPSHRAIYRYFRDTEDAGVDVLFLSLADHLATRGPRLNLVQWQEHAQMIKYVLTERFDQESRVTPPKLISGHDLINIFHMSPGAKMGQLLEAVREAQASGELNTRDEALDYIRKHLPNQGQIDQYDEKE